MKNLKKAAFFACLTIASGGYSQDCNNSPSTFTDYVASGQFAIMGSADDEYNDVVMLHQAGAYTYIDVLKGDVYDNRVLDKNVSSFNYDLSKVDGRMVAGDFNRDGWHNDFALIYEVSASTMRIDVFVSNNASNPSFTQSTFLTLTGYNASNVTGRVVSGDFDRDGYWDDIAMFYDYGNGETRIHMFQSNGSTFSYSGNSGWWSTQGYTAGQITDRVVSGDFDQDGKEDDIAAFYDYGGGQTRIHVWLSTGSSFAYQSGNGWWSSYGYSAGQVSGRVVAVNIDRSSKIFDDIAVFYDYGGGQTRMHVFESTGSSFNYSGPTGWWSSNGYTASQITGKVAAIDTRSGIDGGKIGDIIAFYDYGSTTTKYHIWRSFNPLFSAPYVTYSHHNYCGKSMETITEEQSEITVGSAGINIYPNPTENYVYVTSGNNDDLVNIEAFNTLGEMVAKSSIASGGVFDLSDQVSGIYILKIEVNSVISTYRVTKK